MKRLPTPYFLKFATLALLAALGVWFAVDLNSTSVGYKAHPLSSPTLEPLPAATVAPATEPVPAVPATPAPDVSAPGTKSLFAQPRNPTGTRLDLSGEAYFKAQIKGEHLIGRTGDVDVASFASLNDLAKGDKVSFPLFDGETVRGVVEVAQVEDNGWRRVGGPLVGERNGWFSFGFNGSEAAGLVRLNSERLAYQIAPGKNGAIQLIERPLNDVVCLSMPKPPPDLQTEPVRHRAVAAAPVVTPILNSRPGTPATLFLDFDGASIDDPDWGSIKAKRSRLTAVQRQDVWRRVKEDFLEFNINITTDQGVYKKATPGSRMRCIITPTDDAAPGAGGVAFLGSFSGAGKYFSANVPCFVFNPTVKSIADAVSHEFGHTFGLYHDGKLTRNGFFEYFVGHGSGPTSWGPIMGAPYRVSLQQWSKGEYEGANRFEDDIEIIANETNAFGYAPDQVGDTAATATPISFTNGIVEQRGVIETLTDVDVFSFFSANGGSVLVSASGLGATVGNLDVKLDLLNSAGLLVAKNDFVGSLGAGLAAVIGPGFHYLRVRGAGEGDKKLVGYSRYGSRGAYTIVGTVP